jgi:hypothetical protein
MSGRGSSERSTEDLWPSVNGWIAGNHRITTYVDAGADGRDHSTGRFIVSRNNALTVTAQVKVVDVPSAGPLRITHAPLGPSVVKWAPTRANLRFTSRNGVTGTLHLKDFSVTLDKPVD